MRSGLKQPRKGLSTTKVDTTTSIKKKPVVDAGVCITQESDSKLLAIIRAAHALLAAGDAEAARDLLASFSSPGVDALC
jgi:hypothetical protein